MCQEKHSPLLFLLFLLFFPLSLSAHPSIPFFPPPLSPLHPISFLEFGGKLWARKWYFCFTIHVLLLLKVLIQREVLDDVLWHSFLLFLRVSGYPSGMKPCPDIPIMAATIPHCSWWHSLAKATFYKILQ